MSRKNRLGSFDRRGIIGFSAPHFVSHVEVQIPRNVDIALVSVCVVINQKPASHQAGGFLPIRLLMMILHPIPRFNARTDLLFDVLHCIFHLSGRVSYRTFYLICRVVNRCFYSFCGILNRSVK